jgi:O-antigen/teichoic acid export membrane protein
LSLQKNINTSLIYQIAITILVFASLLLVTRILSVDSRGQLSIYTNAVTLASTIFSFSLGSAIVYFIAGKKIDVAVILQQIAFVILATSLCLLLLISVLYFTNYQYIITAFSNRYAYLLVFVLHTVLAILQVYFIALFNTESNFVTPLKVQFVALLLQNAVLLFMYSNWIEVTATCNTIVLIIAGFLCIQIVALMYYYFKNKTLIIFKNKPKIYLPLFKYSALAFACNAVQMFSYRIDLWFLQAYHNTSIVAVYAIAVACLQMLWVLSNQVVAVLFTTFTKQQQQANLPSKIAQIHNFLFWISLMFFSIAWLCSYYCIPLFFGSAYASSVPLFGVLLLGGIPISSALVITAFNSSQNKLRINLNGSIIGLLICLLLNFALIPKYSYYGAAIASAIAYLVNCIYLWIQFATANNISFAALFLPSISQFKNIKHTWHELQQS